MIASGINLGRRRGEMEGATKAWVSARGGHRDPETAGFCEMGALADAAAAAATIFNGQVKEGRVLRGAPDEIWAQEAGDMAARQPTAEQMHVFMGETREVALRAGHVFARVSGVELAWTEPELFAALGQGYRVAIRFDATEPGLGCAVFNREVGSRNRWGFGVGQLLGMAEFDPAAPQITACHGLVADERTAEYRKRFNAAVRTEYRAIGVFGRRGRAAVSAARDGRGSVVQVERGAAVDVEAATVAAERGKGRGACVGVERTATVAPVKMDWQVARRRSDATAADVAELERSLDLSVSVVE